MSVPAFEQEVRTIWSVAGGVVDVSRGDQQPEGGTLTTREVAAVLRISPRTIRRWAAQGRLPAMVLRGGLYGFAPEEVEALARQLGVRPSG